MACPATSPWSASPGPSLGGASETHVDHFSCPHAKFKLHKPVLLIVDQNKQRPTCAARPSNIYCLAYLQMEIPVVSFSPRLPMCGPTCQYRGACQALCVGPWCMRTTTEDTYTLCTNIARHCTGLSCAMWVWGQTCIHSLFNATLLRACNCATLYVATAVVPE